ncbi:MAG: serine hydrolase [Bacteroidota bacterium]
MNRLLTRDLKSVLIALFIFSCFFAQAQTQIIRGTIIDANTKEPLVFATIALENNRLGTISNSKGEFRLRVPKEYQNQSMRISFIGYKLFEIPLSSIKGKQTFDLKPEDYILNEVVVKDFTGIGIIKKALERIPENYHKAPYKSEEFYSEIIKNENEYAHISEAVYEIFHDRSLKSNQLKLVKNRNIKDREIFGAADATSSVKGLVNSDFINNLEDGINLINKRGLKIHDFNFEGTSKINNEEVFVISFHPNNKSKAVAYKGKCYIQTNNFAFLYFDFKVDPKRNKKVNLVDGGIAGRTLAKLFGIEAELLDSHNTLSYRKIGDRYYFDKENFIYEFRFRYGADEYVLKSESILTVNNFKLDGVKPFTESEILGRNKKIEFQDAFNDFNFWEEYNTVLPEVNYTDVATKIQAKNESLGFRKRISKNLSTYLKSRKLKNQNIEDYSLEEYIDQWANVFMKDNEVPGLQLAVLKNDSLIYSKGLGYSDKESKKDITTNTQMRIASVTKPITAVGILKLASEGKIDLDKPVQYYVPSFPEKKYPVTTKQLLGHLGGIRDYYEVSLEDEVFIQDHYNSSTEALSIFKDDSLVTEPGTEFVYSSFGYRHLGAVIEGASGKNYLDYMKEEVWEPLKMDFTYGEVADSIMKYKSKFYFLSGDEATPYDLSSSYPSGGLLSTAGDLVTFGSAIMKGELLSDTLKEQMFQTQNTFEGVSTGYGLGWYIGKDFNGTQAWYHAGELPSTGSIIVIYPEHDLIIALITNSPIIYSSNDGFSEYIQELGERVYSYSRY